MTQSNFDKFVEAEIKYRSTVAKKLAKKFPELKGLSFESFLEKLPMRLDFITSCEMFDELNKK